STANYWPNITQGIRNVLEALRGKLTYYDNKRRQTVGIRQSSTVVWTRTRGLHLSQAGVLPDRNELVSASLFDAAMVAYQVDPVRLVHPLSSYVPRSALDGCERWAWTVASA